MSGLKRRYSIKRSDGTMVPADGMYFVLKLNSSDSVHAAASRAAARAYAEVIEGQRSQLSDDLLTVVDELEITGESRRWLEALS